MNKLAILFHDEIVCTCIALFAMEDIPPGSLIRIIDYFLLDCKFSTNGLTAEKITKVDGNESLDCLSNNET